MRNQPSASRAAPASSVRWSPCLSPRKNRWVPRPIIWPGEGIRGNWTLRSTCSLRYSSPEDDQTKEPVMRNQRFVKVVAWAAVLALLLTVAISLAGAFR